MMKVYKVELKEPHEGKKEYYFTCMAAIFDKLGRSVVGCQISTLWRCKVSSGHVYEGKKCTIRRVDVSSRGE